MPIPIAHTLITVRGLRPQMEYDPDGQGYDGDLPIPNDLAVHVRASISQPSGKRRDEQDESGWTLSCDPIDNIGLSKYDIVIDETTGTAYEVVWVTESPNTSVGLNHIKARLRAARGLTSGGGDNDVTA